MIKAKVVTEHLLYHKSREDEVGSVINNIETVYSMSDTIVYFKDSAVNFHLNSFKAIMNEHRLACCCWNVEQVYIFPLSFFFLLFLFPSSCLPLPFSHCPPLPPWFQQLSLNKFNEFSRMYLIEWFSHFWGLTDYRPNKYYIEVSNIPLPIPHLTSIHPAATTSKYPLLKHLQLSAPQYYNTS